MKVFCFFFSVYILLLSLAPCEEFAVKAELRFDEVSEQVQFHSTDDETGDDCSPFCICSCCHFSTVYQFKNFAVTNKITIAAISTSQGSYQNPYAKDFKTSIWQPPKFNSIA